MNKMNCKYLKTSRSPDLAQTFIFATLFVISSTWIAATQGERVLFLLPMSSKSMANVFEPLAKGLAAKGHQLTIFTPASFKIKSENVTEMVPMSAEELFKDYPDPFDIRRQSRLFFFPIPFQQKYCTQLLENPEFTDLANEKFDLIIMNTFYHDCFAGIVHKIGSPIIFVASLPAPSGMTELLGTHQPSSFLPICVLGDISAQLSFTQRTKNFMYNVYFSIMLDYWMRPKMESLYREKMGNDMPSIVQVYKKQASMILMNSHFGLTNPRPYLPNIVEIGGIHCKPAKPLPKDLEDFVSSAKDGFIVFSLGSIVKASHMPESVRLAFVRTFAKLKQRVIWKWDKDEGMPDISENVKLVKWLPQQDLLGHPNIRLFITHGGLLSTEEAVYHGVPVIGFPVFVDQDANMKQAEIHRFGVKAEILNLTESKLTPLVRRVLDDPRYGQKAKEMSVIFKDQPQTALERGLFWTEYVLRHKGAYHLKSPAMDLNLLQYHCIDVIVFLAAIAITFLLFVYYTIKLLFRMGFWMFSSSPTKSVRGSKKRGLKIKTKKH